MDVVRIGTQLEGIRTFQLVKTFFLGALSRKPLTGGKS